MWGAYSPRRDNSRAFSEPGTSDKLRCSRLTGLIVILSTCILVRFKSCHRVQQTGKQYRQAYIYTLIYIGDQGMFYLFVGHGDRHLGAFAKRCINNRTISHDAKGAVPIVYCLRKMHLLGSKLHAGYSIPLRFYLGWSAFWGRCQKIRVRPYYILYDRRGGLLRLGFGVVPASIYYCNAVPVI